MTAYRARVGFISASSRWGTHYDHFLALAPPDVSVEIKPLGLWQQSLDDLKDAAEVHFEKTMALLRENQWDGIAVMGAPVQVANPGLIERIRAEAGVPVTSALESGAAALKAFGVKRALLLTPFDAGRNEQLRQHLAGKGIEALLPKTPLRKDDSDVSPQTAGDYTPEEVYQLAVNGFREVGNAEAIYFQGAPLDPLAVWERLETELGIPVVTSNPAMLWHILSLLGLRFNLPGGRLLQEWPQPVAA